MKPKKSRKASQPISEFRCPFCDKIYKFETGLLKHCCRKKKRFLNRDTKHARFGYIAYRLFYESNYARKLAPTQEQFEGSSVYDGFVRFGKFVDDVNAIAPEEFMRYVVRSKLPLDKWCSDALYEEYARLITMHESYDRALERNVLLMVSWANQEIERKYQNFFREISPALALQYLRSGRISPWVILNCQSGKDLIARFSNEQFDLLGKVLDMKFWTKKFVENINDVRLIEKILRSEGL